MSLLVASDPEVFVKSKATGEYVSAIGLLGGTKDMPRRVEHGTVQEDNIMAEVAPFPAVSREGFIENNLNVLNDLQIILDEFGLEYEAIPSIVATPDMLANPMAHISGCDMDYNAWEMRENPAPDIVNTNLRTAGGHIHMSHPIFAKQGAAAVAARLFDKYIGLPSVILDDDVRRAELYGTAGRHRITKYPNGDRGVEYRTVSNWWIRKPEYMGWIYDQTVNVLMDTIHIFENKDYYKAAEHSYLQQVIDNNDIDNAKYYVNALGISMP